ncbi:MAG: hypothetical protein ABEJ03_04920 [Candidatus Nanohaloarchaea archaeon]
MTQSIFRMRGEYRGPEPKLERELQGSDTTDDHKTLDEIKDELREQEESRSETTDKEEITRNLEDMPESGVEISATDARGRYENPEARELVEEIENRFEDIGYEVQTEARVAAEMDSKQEVLNPFIRLRRDEHSEVFRVEMHQSGEDELTYKVVRESTIDYHHAKSAGEIVMDVIEEHGYEAKESRIR